MGKELCYYFNYLEKTEQPQLNLTITHKKRPRGKKVFLLFFPPQSKHEAKVAYLFQMCLFILSPPTYGLDYCNAFHGGTASKKILQTQVL